MYYERAINYYETDQMGIVHHSNYIRYMEEARTYYFTQFGFPYHEIEESGILIPVLNVSGEYRKACRFGEVFQIYIKPEFFNGIKLKLSYTLSLKGNDEIYFKGESTHCFVDKNMRPVRMKRDYNVIYEAMNQWVLEYEKLEK